MLDNNDPLFDVVHSLPVLSYSVALAQRTPTAGCNQPTKYMPDYGGYLETTTSRLRNNALASGIQFDTKPQIGRVKFVDFPLQTNGSTLNPSDSLIVTSYLDNERSNDLSVIRLHGSCVTFDLLTRVTHSDQFRSHRYGNISLKDRNSTGLKHTKSRSDHLLVKCSKYVRIYELNPSYNTDETLRTDNVENRPAFNQVTSIKDRTGYSVKDASLNPHNNTSLAIASDNSNIHSVKIFDSSTDRRQPIQNVEWATLGNEFPSAETCLLSKELRGRVVRTFIPMRPTNWGTQQLDHVPSHLFNILVTNEHKIGLIDPRISSLAQNYIIKSELPSFYPIEYLRRTVFSIKNDYQFYSMTNVHLRVIDSRYPGVPVGQIAHMLDSETYNSMELKLIEYPDCDLETLCCSSSSRLCFITFDQARFNALVNPRSVHLPYHDSSFSDESADGTNAFGLSAITSVANSINDELFSIYQLSSRGDLLVRSFTRARKLDLEQSFAKVNLMSEEDHDRPHELSKPSVPIYQTHEMPDRVFVEDEASPSPEGLIDLLDSSFLSDIENTLESKRAQEKYNLMKSKLYKA